MLLNFNEDVGDHFRFLLRCASLHDVCMLVLMKHCRDIRGDPNGKLNHAGFSFTGSLSSAVQVALRLRCFARLEYLAGVVRSLKVKEKYGSDPINEILTYFVSAHESEYAQSFCPELLVSLLELYLDLPKVIKDYEEALLLSASWHFYLSPSVPGYSHALSLWKPRTMPDEYDPSALLH